MLILLVIISLALNILAFLIIAILFLRQNKLIKMEDNLKRPIHEMEELTAAYLLQMKEENDRFINRLNQVNKDGQDSETTSINEFEVKPSEEEHTDQPNIAIDRLDLQENDMPFIKKTISQQAVMAYQKQKQNGKIPINSDVSTMTVEQNNQADNRPITVNHNLDDQIIHLRKQGYKIEEIAKMLNKGKTEIELLLKFKEDIQE